MKKYAIVTGDYNDGDYVTEKNEITDDEINQLKTIIQVLNENDNHWSTSDQRDNRQMSYYKDKLTEDDVNLISKFIPYAEYGIHTIESIEILTVTEELKLL